MTTLDIENAEDFIRAGFKECEGCGWAFDPAWYDKHDCDEMIKETKEADERERLGIKSELPE